MPQKHQVNFRVTDSFLNRIKSECIKREMSLQELITAALTVYFRTPDEWDCGTLFTWKEDRGSDGNRWLTLCYKYFEKMPREKVDLIREVMELDLLHYRSSRRKADLKKRQGRAGNGGRRKTGR